jgi:hypothetical protein
VLPQLQEGDRLAVERLCRLEDEAAALHRAVRAEGVVLTPAIQTAKGEVAGWQTIPNPALLPLRKIGAELAALSSAPGGLGGSRWRHAGGTAPSAHAEPTRGK